MSSKKINLEDFLGVLSEEYNLNNQYKLADFLKLSQGRISQIKQSNNFTKRKLKTLIKGIFKSGKNAGLAAKDSKKLDPSDFLEILAEKFKLDGQSQIAVFLGLTQGRISQIKKSNQLTRTNSKTLFDSIFNAGKKDGMANVNNKILNSFNKVRKTKNQTHLAKILGITQGAIPQWKSGNTSISFEVLKKLFTLASSTKIQAIVEMEPIDPGKPGGKWYFFHEKSNQKRNTLLKKLKGLSGLYCYYDNKGLLTYVGKSHQTPLDKEVEGRLIAKVSKKRIPYGAGLKKQTQDLCQGDIAKFISVYEITPKSSIPLIEALLIRSTANTQFNNRLENLP